MATANPKTLEEANYGYIRCENCGFFSAGKCKRFHDAPVKSNYVCIEWKRRGSNDS